MPVPPDELWDAEREPDLPQDLLAMRLIAAGHKPSNDAQRRMKKYMDENFAGFMKLKREMEREYREQRQGQEQGEQAAGDDPGTQAALAAAEEWLKRHGDGDEKEGP